MTVARYYHAAVLLNNGKVMVSGGNGATGARTPSVDLYNPETGAFIPVNNLLTARSIHTVTLLADGRVLLAGGRGPVVVNGSNRLRSAEIYDPSTGIVTATGDMTTARNDHTATLLSNGRVLITGGIGSNGTTLSSAELFDPTSGTFTATGNMTTARIVHTASLLANGQVLIVGGENGGPIASAEVFDPATGTFSAVGTMATARSFHTATTLKSRAVLITGGIGLSSAELYNPSSATFSPVGNMSSIRYDHQATLLKSGKVLVSGGQISSSQSTASADVYDPATATFSRVGDMTMPRDSHTATLLGNGKVLIAGGYDYAAGNYAFASAELFTPAVEPPAVEPPSISSISPLRGVVGSKVTLTGRNFYGTTDVSLNGVSAAFSVVSPTQIVMTVPSGATTGLIRVTTPDGTATYFTPFEVFASDSSGAIISEFRFHGANGPADEYVELLNKNIAPLNISGWSLQTRTASGLQTTVVPTGTFIPSFGHYLLTGTGYSLSGYGTSDQSIPGDMLDASGVSLLNALGAVQDAAGFTTSDVTLREGSGIPSAPNVDGEYAMTRNFVVSQSKDTGDNAADFLLVSTTGAAVPGTNGDLPGLLGAPSPEGLTSPSYANHLFNSTLFDTTNGADVMSISNRERVMDTGLGYLLLRRTMTNRSGRTITRVRLTVTSITTLGTVIPAGVSDVRLVSSEAASVTRLDGSVGQLSGVTLESGGAGQPNNQALGGGMGSSVLLLDVPLAPGESRSYVLKLLIMRKGSYYIALNILGSLGS